MTPEYLKLKEEKLAEFRKNALHENGTITMFYMPTASEEDVILLKYELSQLTGDELMTELTYVFDTYNIKTSHPSYKDMLRAYHKELTQFWSGDPDRYPGRVMNNNPKFN